MAVKRGSLIKGNNKFLDVMGFKTRNVHIGSMSADEVVEGESPLSRQIAIELTPEEKSKLKGRFHALMKERGHYDDPFKLVESSSAFSDDNSMNTEVHQLKNGIIEEERRESICLGIQNDKPAMNICMMAVGSWDESVHQFIAVGLRLKADGHCVRIATNDVHRDRIVSAGLKFYPLRGNITTVNKFLEYVHRQVQHKTRNKLRLLNFAHHQDPFSDVDDLRELVFSLWPACVEVDPLIPGETFRADAIIAHPNLFGQTIVAERLGVPVHCMSDTPQSRTQAFTNLLCTSIELSRPYRSALANAVSYDVVDKLVHDSLGDILDEFRYSLVLTGKTTVKNLLKDWRTPHTYLWNPVLLPKPQDWRSETTVAGYVELEEHQCDDFDHFDIAAVEEEQQSFTENHVGTPIIYFGLQCGDWDSRRVQDLISILAKAAQTASVCIIFQSNKNDKGRNCGNDAVFEIGWHFPMKRILRYVHSAVHWGDLSIMSTCLSAAKPACVVLRSTTQRLWGQTLASSGVGVRPLDITTLTQSNLFDTFQALLDPKLAECAKRFAPTFSSSKAIEAAVSAFYTNLPLAGMTCDLDPKRIARVYDSVHELKLSYEARLVVHQITGDGGSAGDLKYKPLKYSQRHPPKFSLRQLDTERLRSSSGSSSQVHVVYTHDPTSEDLEKGRSPRKRRFSLLRGQSMALNVVEMPKYWNSLEEQTKNVEEINAKYEHLLFARECHCGSSLTSSASSSASR